jgi:hypothetical protein
MPPALKTGSAEDFGHVASPDTNAATNAGATRRDVVGWTVRVIASEPAAKGGFTEYLLEVQVAGLVKNIVRKRCRAGLGAGGALGVARRQRASIGLAFLRSAHPPRLTRGRADPRYSAFEQLHDDAMALRCDGKDVPLSATDWGKVLMDAFPPHNYAPDGEALREQRVAALNHYLELALQLHRAEVDDCITNFLELRLPKDEGGGGIGRADFDQARKDLQASIQRINGVPTQDLAEFASNGEATPVAYVRTRRHSNPMEDLTAFRLSEPTVYDSDQGSITYRPLKRQMGCTRAKVVLLLACTGLIALAAGVRHHEEDKTHRVTTHQSTCDQDLMRRCAVPRLQSAAKCLECAKVNTSKTDACTAHAQQGFCADQQCMKALSKSCADVRDKAKWKMDCRPACALCTEPYQKDKVPCSTGEATAFCGARCASTPPVRFGCSAIGACVANATGPYTSNTCAGKCAAPPPPTPLHFLYTCTTMRGGHQCVVSPTGIYANSDCNKTCIAPPPPTPPPTPPPPTTKCAAGPLLLSVV